MLEKCCVVGEIIVVIGVVYDDLFYLLGDVEVEELVFDLLIDVLVESSWLFFMLNMLVNLQDYCIGFYVSVLVCDGGILQIGIGLMGDVLIVVLLLCQCDNVIYWVLIDELGVCVCWVEMIECDGGLELFCWGFYGCSEMFVLGLLVLVEVGVLSCWVYFDEVWQCVVECGEVLVEGGVWLYGGFFFGLLVFYWCLCEMLLEECVGIGMIGIGFVNNLYCQEELKCLQWCDVCFINSVFIVILFGVGVVDQLEDGWVFSGVGGQYNFVV